ncbi:hypothetical protein J6590_096658 [Homalodisca vitripennis]|nr:hypothetical protein J6590_096658 [Homalodisca vitripennis]
MATRVTMPSRHSLEHYCQNKVIGRRKNGLGGDFQIPINGCADELLLRTILLSGHLSKQQPHLIRVSHDNRRPQ